LCQREEGDEGSAGEAFNGISQVCHVRQVSEKQGRARQVHSSVYQ